MDLDAGNNYPNPYNLFAADFGYDDDAYRTALAFLGDLASGSDHDVALELNGGNQAMLRAWQGSDKFRRVYQKCRAAGDDEREALAARESAQEATEGDEAGVPSGQTFVPLEALPVRRSVFSTQPDRGSWGE